MKARLYTVLTALSLTLAATAQSRRMAILDMPASPRSLSLGGSAIGADGSVYADPSLPVIGDTSTATADKTMTSAAYSFGLVDADAGNMGIHTLTASHRTGRGALLFGARYYAQGRLGRELDIDMKPVGDRRRLYSYTVDAGYVHRLGRVAVYGSAGVASEQTVAQSTACRISLGAACSGRLGAASWQAGAAVRDLGFAVADNKSHALAPLAHAGGRLTLPTFARQSISVVADGGAYLPLDDNKASGTFGGGLLYDFADRLTLSAGGHTGDHDEYVGAGIGVRVGVVRIDAAAKFALDDGLSNIYMLGAAVTL